MLAGAGAGPRRWGEALLDADTERIGDVSAVGAGEHLMWLRGRFRPKSRATGIVDVEAGWLLDTVPGRTTGPARWLLDRPPEWRGQIRGGGVLDSSGPYRAAFDAASPAGRCSNTLHPT